MSVEMNRPSRPTVPQPVSAWLQAHPQLAHALPAPDEEWTVREQDMIGDSAHGVLREHGGVRKVGETRCKDGTVAVWQVTEAVAAFVEHNVTEPSLTPCGHTGVVNLGDTYTCQTETCDARFDRETALEVLKS